MCKVLDKESREMRDNDCVEVLDNECWEMRDNECVRSVRQGVYGDEKQWRVLDKECREMDNEYVEGVRQGTISVYVVLGKVCGVGYSTRRTLGRVRDTVQGQSDDILCVLCSNRKFVIIIIIIIIHYFA
ncbi:hypothetical protein CHS0354_034777 [Potamilus streckersoni]|uniref:Uncharacterized protein n=1 Tax=Potamilus streckersoni TaxID=2493646 RepID=A0AAE0VHZ7_9BIVA|nr:hypothetical protein CHS0354_034777 [Potamilus streckersoni]